MSSNIPRYLYLISLPTIGCLISGVRILPPRHESDIAFRRRSHPRPLALAPSHKKRQGGPVGIACALQRRLLCGGDVVVAGIQVRQRPQAIYLHCPQLPAIYGIADVDYDRRCRLLRLLLAATRCYRGCR
jgi:hypothetical protein